MEDSDMEMVSSDARQGGKPQAAVLFLVGAALLVAGVFAWKSLSSKPAATTPVEAEMTHEGGESVEEEAPLAASDEPAEDTNAEVKLFELEAGSFYYKPNEIRVKKGDRVRIVIKSVSMMHDLVIDELDVRIPITKSGEMGEVEFVANEAGEFTFYCSVGDHRKMGQTGTLIVEE